jgi:D-alanyl-lipoteichoic acid acyltransferase DltB (MBOAT superfamily)
MELSGLGKATKIRHYIQVLITFALICFAWTFFRARNIQDAFYITGHLFSGVGSFFIKLLFCLGQPAKAKGVLAPFALGQGNLEFLLAVFSIVFLLII